MRISIAISLMEDNPTTEFSWNDELIQVINGFLPSTDKIPDDCKDLTVIKDKISSLDPATQDILMAYKLTSDITGKNTRVYRNSSAIFIIAGTALCIIALFLSIGMMTFTSIDNIVKIIDQLIEILRIFTGQSTQ